MSLGISNKNLKDVNLNLKYPPKDFEELFETRDRDVKRLWEINRKGTLRFLEINDSRMNLVTQNMIQ